VSEKLTEADFNGWRFTRDAVHFNGGREFFGCGHRCVDQPRLLVIDKYFKKDRSTQRSYLVDGKTPCTTLDEALAALDHPPKVTADEIDLLRALPSDWSQPERRGPYLPLADMGLVEWSRDNDDNVVLRPTPAGRAALKEGSRQ